MKIHGRPGGRVGAHALGDETGNHARQHIPHAGGGHAGVAGGVDIDAAVRVGDDGARALEHDVEVECDREIPGTGDAVLLDRGDACAGQPRHLPGVRREHGLHGEAFEDLQAAGQVVKAVGVDHERQRAAADQLGDQLAGLGVLAQAGPDGEAALARR